MELELCFFVTFRKVMGRKPTRWRVDDGATAEDVLRSPEAEYDDPAGRFIKDGEAKLYVNMLKNGHEVIHLNRMATVLDNGDTVSVLPPVAGG